MIAENLLTLLAVLPFLGAILAATMPDESRDALATAAAMVLGAMLVVLFALQGWVDNGGVVSVSVRWVDSLGLNLRFRIDGLSWLMMVLVAGIGLLVMIYARHYMAANAAFSRFYALMLAFTGAMSGVLISGNIVLLAVCWELTSITSFFLIAYAHQRPEARRGARVALSVTVAGGLCLLVAMLMLGHVAGSYELDAVLAAGADVRAHPLYPAILVLTLLAAFTKSAQFPFHFWLPNAMAAPTPVSAYLHSATMVKAGVFLLVRFFPVLGGTDPWFYLVVVTGMVTLTLGAVMALFKQDLKGLLAYSTISNLGLITVLAGIGSPEAIVAAVFHIVNHAVFKASLFMGAGIVDHQTGTRDMRRLSGLRRWMPVTAVMTTIAAAAMAGVPLVNGFLSKEMFFEVTTAWNNDSVLDAALPYVATFAGAFSVAYSLRFVHTVFFGPPATDLPKMPPEEPPGAMRRPAEILVLITLAVGIFPSLMLGSVLQDAAVAVLGTGTPEFSIKLWHGITVPLMMSVAATLGGTLIYVLGRHWLARRPGDEVPPRRFEALVIYEEAVKALTLTIPRRLHGLTSVSSLQAQLLAIVLVAIAAAVAVLPGTVWVPARPIFSLPEAVFALVWMVGGICAIGTAWQAKYHRFAALVMLGGVGLMTVLSFAWLSAPDLAVTQLVVEITTTILLLLGLRWLPQRNVDIPGDNDWPARVRRGRDLLIALLGGGGMAAIAYAVMAAPKVPSVGDWFLRNAYAEGGGTNVVNVILTDFRAFDTLGEIVVLGTVALTVFALLRRFRPDPESAHPPKPQAGDVSLEAMIFVPALLMRWMFPVTVMLASYFFLRGHDLPGGGFAAGVTLAIGLALQYIATDVRWIEARIVVLPIRWVAFGLSLAAAVGCASWLFGYPFMTAHAQYVTLPLIGRVPAATAMVFDLGVFAVVLGSVTLIVISIAHQSLRVGGNRSRPPADIAAAAAAAEKEAGAAAEKGAEAAA